MKTKTPLCSLFLVTASLFTAANSHADCKPAYADAIKTQEGRANPARGTFFASGGGAVLTPVFAAAVGVNLTPAALITAPATAIAAGSFMSAVIIKKHTFQRALRLIQDCEAGSGKMLDRFLDDLNIDPQDSAAKQQAIAWVLSENSANQFCKPSGERGVIKPFSYHRILSAAEDSFSQE